MKRWISALAPSALALMIASGCASQQPPSELRDARIAYDRARNGPAAQTNRGGVIEAWHSLDAAEREYAENPSSDKVKTLAYVAQRKAEIAEADGRAAEDWARQNQAEKTFLQMQTAQAQREAQQQRQQAAQAQQQAGVQGRRAKVALERLGLATKEEARGTVITLPNANMFATNKADILPSAQGRLTEIANGVKEILSQAPEEAGRKITLVGYTDSRGSDQHNMDLSRRRAEAVRTFFAQRGLNASMIDTEGRGEADPIADNKTKQGRAENRRVEIVISPPSSQGTQQGTPQGSNPNPR